MIEELKKIPNVVDVIFIEKEGKRICKIITDLVLHAKAPKFDKEKLDTLENRIAPFQEAIVQLPDIDEVRLSNSHTSV